MAMSPCIDYRRDRLADHARQAGEDLVAAQLPSGKFRNSAFQQGPMEGGSRMKRPSM